MGAGRDNSGGIIMQYIITYDAGVPQRDFGKLFTCWQGDDCVDSVVLSLENEQRSVSGVDIVLRNPNGDTALYTFSVGLSADGEYGISVQDNVVTWKVDLLATQKIGTNEVQIHLSFPDNTQGVLASFRYVVKQSYPIRPTSFMVFPTASEIKYSEDQRSQAEAQREEAEKMRALMMEEILARCREAAQRCEGLVIGIIPPPYWKDVLDKPSVFPPSEHLHEISDVRSLEQALLSKEASGAAATVNAALILHTQSSAHITQEERTAWNSKAPGEHSHELSDIQELSGVIRGNVYNTGSGAFAIDPASWTENTAEDRYEYTLESERITRNTRVTIVLDDACKGRFNVFALDPSENRVQICVDLLPGVAISGRWYTDEVRA